MSSYNSERSLLLLLILWLAAISIARADTSARVVETAPSASATLGRSEYFWVRIEYATDEPISLWARPFRDGAPVQKAMSHASLTYTDSGEALGWFALIEPGKVDEVRIKAGGGKPYREWELARHPVDLYWTNGPATGTARPMWVEDLLEVENAQREEDARRRASEPTSAGEVAFFNGFMLLVLGLVVAGIGVPLWSVWKWHGRWRIAAALPAAVMAFVVLRIVVDTARDPTSHNLWPFEILMFGTMSLMAIGALKMLRRFLGVH